MNKYRRIAVPEIRRGMVNPIHGKVTAYRKNKHAVRVDYEDGVTRWYRHDLDVSMFA